MKRAPKPARRLRKAIASQIQDGREALRSRWGQLTLEAAWSLQMEPTPAAAGISVLDGCEPSGAEQQRAADMIHARVLDMLEAVGRTHYGSSPIAAERAEIRARQGEGFLEAVAATGEPAKKAALRIASVLIAVLIFVGGFSPVDLRLPGSHKIHAVNFLARARAAFENALWKWFCGGWGRAFTGGSPPRSRAGLWFVRSSCASEGRNALRSLCTSTLARTTPRRSSSCQSLSTQSGERAERSSGRRRQRHRGLHCESSLGARARRSPEDWALYRLRVQNVLLEQVEPAAVTP